MWGGGEWGRRGVGIKAHAARKMGGPGRLGGSTGASTRATTQDVVHVPLGPARRGCPVGGWCLTVVGDVQALGLHLGGHPEQANLLEQHEEGGHQGCRQAGGAGGNEARQDKRRARGCQAHESLLCGMHARARTHERAPSVESCWRRRTLHPPPRPANPSSPRVHAPTTRMHVQLAASTLALPPMMKLHKGGGRGGSVAGERGHKGPRVARDATSHASTHARLGGSAAVQRNVCSATVAPGRFRVRPWCTHP